jgi:hypothetical protein
MRATTIRAKNASSSKTASCWVPRIWPSHHQKTNVSINPMSWPEAALG